MAGDKKVGSRKKHLPLIVWSADAQAGAPVLEALRQGFDLDLRAALPKFSKRDRAKGPDILLLCLSPLETLCRAMAKGTLPSVALKGWQDQAQAIMALNRGNRRKVRILDVDMAMRHSEAFLHWFGLSCEAGGTALVAPPVQDEILHLLAQRTLTSDASARALLAELEAVSLNFSENRDLEPGDADAAFQSYQDMRQVQEQADLLQAQNRTAQEEIEGLSTDKAQLEAALKQASAQTLKVQEQADLLQAQNRTAQEEIEGLSTDKAQLEAAQDQTAEATERMRQQGEMIQAQNQVMQQELEVLAQGKQQLEQRLEQLGQGIESYQVQMNELRVQNTGLRKKAGDKDRGLQEAGRMLCDLEMQTAHLTQELNKVNTQCDEKQQQLERAEQNLQQFLSSRSYRLTAPLRVLRSLMSRRTPV
jgi:predicted nucleic acid-binding protein